VTSGTGRDLDQVAGLNFPVFTNGACCSHGNCAILSANVPVTVGGLTVFPGDLLHGDRNGVTTIPLEIASEIPDACTEFMVAEQFVLNYVRSGNPTAQGFAAARAEMAHAIDALKQRIRRTP
ncbi:MAG: RraA family protein, partial [Planctomycetaceae bacterium]|nr:RraA family protein [Planctomycetaceae bacterium]